ncbi:unnamed protein product [Triticum turgidum subsp. durum]|uniref:HP domain-containing protein n=1 Tax=Triticum turgidum subsp. durum TaxID=4567 RepID=A0A9R1QXA3_TRITD|nr:unnamed protein product [Triticum turgidum subsp. durum]
MSIEDLSPYVPLYKVSEGNEPCFFKTYFSWDNTKSVIHGNSFQKKLSLLFGLRSEGASRSSGNGGPTQRASALAALSSAFNPSSKPKTPPPSRSGQGSQRAAAVAALSSVLTAEQSGSSDNLKASKTSTTSEKNVAEPEALEVPEEQETEHVGEATFSYDRLISKSTDPIRGIDYKRREAYLSESEFQTVFGITKDAFYQQPGWKQELQKRKADLF